MSNFNERDFTLDNSLKHSVDFVYPTDEEEVQTDKEYVREKGLELLNVMARSLSYIANSKNPRFTSHVVAFSFGFSEGKNQSEISNEFGISKVRLSQEKKKFLEYININL